jgi:hypothetical protein
LNKIVSLKSAGKNFPLILTFFFSGIVIDAVGQEFTAGFNIGGGISKVTYNRDEFREQNKTSLKPAYKAGLSLDLPLTNTFHLYSEYNYAMRGRKVQSDESGWTLNETHHYFEIPLLLNIRKTGQIKRLGPFEHIGPFTWTLGAGPNISYFMGGSGNLETSTLETDYKISFEGHESDFYYITFDPVKRWQWGLDINLGLIAPLANGNELFTSMKFTYGHTNLGNYDSSSMPILGFSDNLAHNYKILSLSVAYLFHFDLREFYRGKSTKGEKVKAKRVDTGPTKKGNNINKIYKK